MASVLHLVKGDSPPLAASIIDASRRDQDAKITVVLLDGPAPPRLPPHISVRRLGEDGLDYSALLDLIFEADHVVTW